MIGTKLVQRYQILERIGGGGMAVVYKARCTLLNRIVAVKVLRHQFAVDEEFVRRFRREAQAAASLSHPNIVNIYDVGQENDIYFIVMEYVEGETLKDFIEREAPLEPARAVNITRQIANALYHAHYNKIIHRDIKPHNVLISKDGRIKVADFGIARAVTSNTQTFSRNSLVGSVHYFSPEQAKGKLATEQSDLYSLGIVLYEMLTKTLPFDGDSPVSIALKHIQQTVPPATRYNPSVPPGLQAILDKLLAKDQSQRYESVIELLSALRTWNTQAATGASETDDKSEEEDTKVFAPVAAPRKKFHLTDAGKKRLRKWSLIGLAVAAAVALAVLGISSLVKFWEVKEITVPSVVEEPKENAVAILEAAGLRNIAFSESHHDTIPANHVIRQKPGANQVVKQSRTIELVISLGPVLIEVPPVEGLDVRVAEANLQAVGLKAVREYEYSETHAADIVIRQDPLAGVEIAKNQEVKLVVSAGPRPFKMPSVIGKTLDEAEKVLADLKVDVRRAWNPSQGDSPGGIVTDQTPAASEEVKPGDIVYLYLRPYNKISRTIDITLNPLAESRIRVVVKDIVGEEIVAEETVTGRYEYTITVTGWETGSISVYVNDGLVDKINF
ncbi:MAG TPA: Stk1 family PASTA domain-containing Ser/Thr kinase [Bacillota bacterium]|nr:Stk1 family PASTA domain-containing Ser/Thr kinase [Bacillota bacterium]HPZ21666.1 Stk1 family PASTA domain-containing Ser/Thr kinase [Bacillota bacterium]HQD19504.1 Stk1 family PASTA domain-containing Ser/Thr kinase [Bacillota bacterium]